MIDLSKAMSNDGLDPHFPQGADAESLTAQPVQTYRCEGASIVRGHRGGRAAPAPLVKNGKESLGGLAETCCVQRGLQELVAG